MLAINHTYFDELNLEGIQIKALGLIAPGHAYDAWFDMLMPGEPAVLVIHGTNEHPAQVGDYPIGDYSAAQPPKHLVVLTGANHFGYTDEICVAEVVST